MISWIPVQVARKRKKVRPPIPRLRVFEFAYSDNVIVDDIGHPIAIQSVDYPAIDDPIVDQDFDPLKQPHITFNVSPCFTIIRRRPTSLAPLTAWPQTSMNSVVVAEHFIQAKKELTLSDPLGFFGHSL